MAPKKSTRRHPISSVPRTPEQRRQAGIETVGSTQEGLSSPPGHSSDEQQASDGMEWEEVDIQAVSSPVKTPLEVEILPVAGPSTPIEITITRQKRSKEDVRKRAAMYAERQYRLEAHKLHTLALLASARIRNGWLNDPLLQARLLSLTPLHLQNAFTAITKRNQPDTIRRGRMFETAIVRLTAWWTSMFEVEEDKGIRSRTWHEVQAINSELINDGKGKRRRVAISQDDDPTRSTKSLMKHALMMKGSRDISAQLFTTLVRGLGVPARLVTSLQSVPWQSMKTYTADIRASQPSGSAGDNSEVFDALSTPRSLAEANSNGLQPATGSASTGVKWNSGPRRSFPVRQKPGAPSDSRLATPEPAGLSEMPVVWTEVFSRPDQRWFPVDPVRDLVNTKRRFEPESTDRRNRMAYVIAFEEDGYARDVTARYTRQFGARVMKARPRSRPGSHWWEEVMKPLTRPYRFHRDDVEDAELEANQSAEGMPNSVAAFKDHPLYALERHLRREETIHPRTQVGTFRGEPVFPRKSVLALKTAENWMRQGRKLKEGEHPLKSVKQRAVTLEKRRAQEMAEIDGEEVTQGLYARWQTEVFRPDPVIDGRVPKNAFGNIDLYVPSMLPYGAVHLPYKGITKVAKSLGFDYAEAVVGFEFRKRRAVPILEGIVVAAEHEEPLLEAYWETAQIAEEQDRIKRRGRALKRWIRLLQGLRIRHRLQTQYSTNAHDASTASALPEEDSGDKAEAGGFLTSIADVIQPYHLPKAMSYVGTTSSYQEAGSNGMQDRTGHWEHEDASVIALRPVSPSTDELNASLDVDEMAQDFPILKTTPHLKTVAQLAAENMHPPVATVDPEIHDAVPFDTDLLERMNQKGDATKADESLARSKKRRHGADRPTSPSESPKHRGRQYTARQVGPPLSTRALRPRKTKTADEIKADRDLEDAIRRAAEESGEDD